MSEPLIPADVNESAAEQTASLQPGGPTQDFKPAGAHPLAPPLPTFMCPGDARQVHVRLGGLCARIQLGQHAEAIAEADEIRPTLGRLDGAAQFRLARVYALASGEIKDPRLQEECCTKALSALENAGNVATEARLVAEDDLDPIRGDPRFKKIL